MPIKNVMVAINSVRLMICLSLALYGGHVQMVLYLFKILNLKCLF